MLQPNGEYVVIVTLTTNESSTKEDKGFLCITISVCDYLIYSKYIGFLHFILPLH